jgi:hypothetical protein
MASCLGTKAATGRIGSIVHAAADPTRRVIATVARTVTVTVAITSVRSPRPISACIHEPAAREVPGNVSRRSGGISI